MTERKFVVIIDNQTIYTSDNRNVFSYGDLIKHFSNAKMTFVDGEIFATTAEGIDHIIGNGPTVWSDAWVIAGYCTCSPYQQVTVCIDELNF